MSGDLRPGRYRLDGLIVHVVENMTDTGAYQSWIENDGIEVGNLGWNLVIDVDDLDPNIKITQLVPEIEAGDVVTSGDGIWIAVLADVGYTDERQLMLIRSDCPEKQYNVDRINEEHGPLKVVYRSPV